MGDKSSVAAFSSPMETGSRENRNEEENGKMSSMRNAETVFRLMPVALSLVALVVMFKNSQSNDFGSISYSDLGAFRYLVHANGICAGYSLLSAIYAALSRPSALPRAWTLFIFDQVLTYVILAAGAASAEVVYLAYKGDVAVTWSDACSSFGGFCHKATVSVAITFVSMICYGLLSLISSYRLFSNYDAPIGYVHKGIEVALFQA